MIFETHAHYDDARFDDDRDILLSAMPQHGIGRIINVGASVASSRASLKLAETYDFVYAAVGVHPSETACLSEESFDWLKRQTNGSKVVAVGEIGLDYYWEKESAVRRLQQHWFRRQLELAVLSGLPVIIHSRDAAADTLRILKETAGKITGVIHCYSYSPELAEELIEMGFYIGVGGVVTFRNAKKLKETVSRIPSDRILLETDCPYMAPEPHRGLRNNSTLIPFIAEQIAAQKGISREEVERITWDNAMRLFFHTKRESSGVSPQ